MRKYFFLLSLFVISAVAVVVFASASDIQYPVKELDNCASEIACRAHCDNSSHSKECLDFAEKNNLMSADEISAARNFLSVSSDGPGGCTTKLSCESYCDSVEHMDECIAFAEKNNLMPSRELEQAKKVQAAKNRGVKMPACGSKKQCDFYCSEAAHMEECIAFAQEAGFMSGQELEDSKKVLAAIKAGFMPPPCAGKEECDVYCSEEDHFDVCLDFALAAGFMDPKDAEVARKTGGKGPGGCRGKEACDAFCRKDGNMETCAQFAYENGMMTKEEFENFKRTGGKGPGGCKTKEECESFCDNPGNQETCFNFAKENGLISKEEIQKMEEGKQQFQQVMQENMQPGGEEHGFAPGTGPNMQLPPEGMGPKEFAPGTGPDAVMNKPPCEGEECRMPFVEPGMMPKTPGMQPAIPLPEGPPVNQPPPPGVSTEPGAGGQIAPGEPVPSVSPAEPVPSPVEQPSSSLDSILGLIFYPLELLLR